MNSIASGIGIDVSKGRLDVKVPGSKAFALSNTKEGIEELLVRLPEGLPVVMESSGGYERLATRLLRSDGYAVRLLNPKKAKQFADAMGRNAKTDPLDATILGLAGVVMPTPIEKTEERQALCDHSRRINKVTKLLEGTRKQLQSPELDSFALASLLRTEVFLVGEKKRMEKEFAKRVKATSVALNYKLLQTIPGVGPITARIVVTELPQDLENLSARQLASYAGVAPMDNSSGQSEKKKRLSKSNKHIKAALYCPAISCIRYQPWATELYAKLTTKGKSHQSAVVAVMRRIMMQIVAVLKRGTPWAKEFTMNT
jgi:transposase